LKLSVIIVNYNVKYFLEQCLYSVRKASTGLDSEIFVVDNNSVDGSVEMVKEKFPEVQLIENIVNTGFSKANNQAILKSSGEFVLLLNPDTVVEDETFKKILEFMDLHPEAGALGVKMIDGKGNFLPESKRGLPTPIVAFYKVFGFSRLFKKSKKFNRYHLGYLDKNETHEVDILAGAFMLIRKSVLDKIGLLDETFFMYGEDIDLSYRIIKAGYKNYYFPETRIIHYKGESTKKSSINYVFVFYNAMIIFAKKHFSQKNARIFSFLINIAVYLRAFVAIAHRFALKIALPLIDFIFIFAGLFALKVYWEQNILSVRGGQYPMEYITMVVPAYILIWLISVFLSGGYDKPFRLSKIVQGILIGTVFILVVYALLSESFRFSRAIIVLGALWAIFFMLTLRMVLHFMNLKNFRLDKPENKRIIIVGKKDEAERVNSIIAQTGINPGFIGIVDSEDTGKVEKGYLGNLHQTAEIIEIYKIDEVIFCAKNMSSEEIINNMSVLKQFEVEFKIAPPESLYIIGSNSIDATGGEMYIININSIASAHNKRNKRFFDLIASLFLFILSPVIIWFIKSPLNFISNIFSVFFGRKTWVGYYEININSALPKLRKSILHPADAFKNKQLSSEMLSHLNIMYSRDYKMTSDLNILVKGFKNLGRH
jgi:O-antigen biosynthesis protein